jgi:hypothetical protein
MGRKHHCGRNRLVRAKSRATQMHSPSLQPRTFRHCAVRTDRRSLLLGTALASTLLLGTLTHPSPASALTCAGDIGTGPAPISHLNVNDFIYCINTEARTNAAGDAIDLSTINANHYIYLNSSGTLTATNAGPARGIFTRTNGNNSPIDIINAGDIVATSTGALAYGIDAVTRINSPLTITNSGDFTVTSNADIAFGIYAQTSYGNSPLTITNNGDFSVSATSSAFGIFGRTYVGHSRFSIENSSDFVINSTASNAYGIFALTTGGHSPIEINNSGGFTITSAIKSFGIDARTFNGSSPIAS